MSIPEDLLHAMNPDWPGKTDRYHYTHSTDEETKAQNNFTKLFSVAGESKTFLHLALPPFDVNFNSKEDFPLELFLVRTQILKRMDLGLEDEILRGPECDVNHLVWDEINNLLFEG